MASRKKINLRGGLWRSVMETTGQPDFSNTNGGLGGPPPGGATGGIGVLTGGGDCAGLNSAIKWVTKTAMDPVLSRRRGEGPRSLGHP